jgi:O-antigen/teichoic acid export membrane protein
MIDGAPPGGRDALDAPTPAGRASRPGDRRGDRWLAGGIVVATLLAYAFQLAGGRILGPELFAPVSVLWTLMFLTGTVGLTPVEQYVAREATAGRRVVSERPQAILVVVVLTAAGAATFTLLTRASLFRGESGFVVLSLLLVATTAPVFLARGLAIGQRRFDLYGLMLGLEGLGRLVLGGIGLLVVGGPVGVAWGVALGPGLALLVPTLRFERRAREPASGAAAAFLAPYIGASGASQLLLAGAPLAVAALGGGPTAISIVFVTFTLLRAPVTIVYLLQGRLLNLLVRLGLAGDTARIGRIRRRIELGGLAAIALAGGTGWLLGPAAVGLLYGEPFRPEPLVAALAATGVAGAGAAQLLGQLLVAAGRTAALARRWTVGLVTPLVVLVAAPTLAGTSPTVTVALAFAAGELAAAAAMARRTAAPERGPVGARE